MEHFFTTYVRTKTVFQTRLKDLKSYDSVRVYMYELTKLGVRGEDLYSLKLRGEIWYDEKGNFKALRNGPIDLDLLKKTKKYDTPKAPLNDLHLYMRDILRMVTIDTPTESLPAYFKAFIYHRKKDLDLFFTVDGFSGRVHTPVVNLKSVLRSKLRIQGKRLCSLDVKQIQPTILARILQENVGNNPFSQAISKGEDVYMLLLSQNVTLKTREDAKKFLYRLIFGYPMEDIGTLFKGDTSWVKWINKFKSTEESKNPHGRDPHTNLAWLLQTKEVEVMSGVWRKLMKQGILFLTIHDDILVQQKEKDRVFMILEQELKRHFESFEIIVKCH
jgi:hypothetical protein